MAIDINSKVIPVLGYGSEDVIGHWNESDNTFLPINGEIMHNLVADFLAEFNAFPLIINVSKTQVDGSLHVYRSFKYSEERTIYMSS